MIERRVLARLAEPAVDGVRVSIYVRCDPEAPLAPVVARLARAREEAQRQLLTRGVADDAARRLLEPIAAWPGEDALREALGRQAHGLGVLVSPRGLELVGELHRHPREAVRTGRRFWLKPLYGEIEPFTYYVLALGSRHPRLLECGRTRVEVISMPSPSLARADRSSPARVAGRAVTSPAQLRAWADALAEVVPRGASIVLAGATPLADAFEAATTQVHGLRTAGELLCGDVDDCPVAELHRESLPLVERHRRARRDAELRALELSIAAGRGADELEPIFHALDGQRVRRLWAAADRELEGAYDRARGEVLLPAAVPDALSVHDLYNLCLGAGVAQGAEIGIAPAALVPGRSGIAAEFG